MGLSPHLRAFPKNAPKFSPKFLSLYFVGPKKSCKIPAKFPAKFPYEKSRKIHRRASAGAQGEEIVWVGDLIPSSRISTSVRRETWDVSQVRFRDSNTWEACFRQVRVAQAMFPPAALFHAGTFALPPSAPKLSHLCPLPHLGLPDLGSPSRRSQRFNSQSESDSARKAFPQFQCQ